MKKTTQQVEQTIITLDDCVKYQGDPVAYVEHVLNFKTLDPGQCDVLDAIAEHDRVAVKAGNGWGKSTALAAACLWYFDCFPFSRIPSTSGSFRQVKRSLWSEIHALARNSKVRSTYNENRTDIERKGYESEWFIAGFSTDNAPQAEGWHAKHLLYVLDEARAVDDSIWQASFKACTTPGAKILAGSIPGDAKGQFYRIFTHLRKTWKCFSYPTAKYKHMKFKALCPERVSQKSIDEKLEDGGESSPFFQTSVLANFSHSADDSVIPLNYFLKAKENVLEPKGSIVHGLDIARYGRDKSCICTRDGGVILSFKEKGGLDTISCSTWAELETGGAPLYLDSCGIGGGVLDALKAKNVENVTGVNVAESPKDKDKFLNSRAELYWRLREKFEKGEIDLTHLDEKTLDKLQAQLTSMGYKFSKGKVQIEGKEEMKRRGLPSPDLADALMLSFYRDSAAIAIDEIRIFPSIAAAENW